MTAETKLILEESSVLENRWFFKIPPNKEVLAYIKKYGGKLHPSYSTFKTGYTVYEFPTYVRLLTNEHPITAEKAPEQVEASTQANFTHVKKTFP